MSRDIIRQFKIIIATFARKQWHFEIIKLLFKWIEYLVSLMFYAAGISELKLMTMLIASPDNCDSWRDLF